MRNSNLTEPRIVYSQEGGFLPIGISSECSISKNEAEELMDYISYSDSDNKHTWPKRESNKLIFGPFCGIIRSSSVAIVLLPKMVLPSTVEVDSKMLNGIFVKLLEKNGELNSAPSNTDIAKLHQQPVYLLDIFIRDFCNQVKNSIRRGYIFRYQNKVENLNTIRGRLELTENLRTNPFDQSHLLCRFDEYSIDNTYNRALKFVLRVLLANALSIQSRSEITWLLHRFDAVSDESYKASDFTDFRFDRTNQQWENLFHQAKKLLEKCYPDVLVFKKKMKNNAYGLPIVFQMNHLFERVLRRRIREVFRRKEIYHHFNVNLQKKLHLARKNETSDFCFGLVPDITVNMNKKIVAILDAKWKIIDPKDHRATVSRTDAYQMNAYADIYRCRSLTLCYPTFNKCDQKYVMSFELNTCRTKRPKLHIVVIDMHDLAFGTEMPEGLDRVFSCVDRP